MHRCFLFFGMKYCIFDVFLFFFFNDTATTEIYTLSLHDALPISRPHRGSFSTDCAPAAGSAARPRSEEHTSELQSPCNLVCRLLLEKKKKHLLMRLYRSSLAMSTPQLDAPQLRSSLEILPPVS